MRTAARLNAAELKHAARGRWLEILARVSGIDAQSLDGKPHPCPRCGGRDRFRLIDVEAGAVLCNQCFHERNGDGLAALQWMLGCTFPEAIQRAADYLDGNPTKNGHPAVNGRPKKPLDLLAAIEVIDDAETLAAAVKTWAATKPPINSEAVLRFEPQLCWWPRTGPARHLCLAFSGRDPREPDKVAAVVLYRVDGEPFPAHRKIGERKVHLVRGSCNCWLWPGDISTLHAAHNLVKCEGLTDAIALASHLPGALAITNTCGAMSTGGLEFGFATGKRVLIVGDADLPGQAGVARFVSPFRKADAANVVAGQLPYPIEENHGKDVRDYLADGHDVLALLPAADQAPCPPTDDGVPDAGRLGTPAMVEESIRLAGRVINALAVEEEQSHREQVCPLTMAQTVDNILELTGGWPRRVGSSLFTHDARGLHTIDSPASLFGWFADCTGVTVEWRRATGCITKEECFEQLKRQVTAYEAVETQPHFPPLAGHYYTHNPVARGNGNAMRWLIDRFCPATDIDRDLLLAAFVTPAWGGPCGARPAFLLTADEGRGVGKSKAAEMVGRVYSGFLDVALNEDIGRLKERLLSPEGRRLRVMRLDNVKTLRFSWAEFEAMLTSPTISGRQLYVGEGQRPNTLTTLITLNGASLSTDMAQRVVPIKLTTPERSGDWEGETLAFIEANRERLMADVAAFFELPAYPLAGHSRWAAWDRDILARLPEPNDAQKVISERRVAADVEGEESEIISDHFSDRLCDLLYSPEESVVHIPTRLAAEWFNAATNDRCKTAAASRHLKQLIAEGRLPCLSPNASRTHGRGFIWRGVHADRLAPTSYDLPDRIEHAQSQLKGGWR